MTIDDTTIQRLNLYKERNIPIHIQKSDNEWLNGYILEIGSDFIIINEFKKQKIAIFFLEIDFIETYVFKDKIKKEGEDGIGE